MTTSRGVSVTFPVSLSRAVIVKRFWPRRRSTWTLHSPLVSAIPESSGRPGAVTVMIAPAAEMPSRRYVVSVSSTERTAVAGLVTDSSGGLE